MTNPNNPNNWNTNNQNHYYGPTQTPWRTGSESWHVSKVQSILAIVMLVCMISVALSPVAIIVFIASIIFGFKQINRGKLENNSLCRTSGILIVCGLIPVIGVITWVIGAIMAMVIWSRGPYYIDTPPRF